MHDATRIKSTSKLANENITRQNICHCQMNYLPFLFTVHSEYNVNRINPVLVWICWVIGFYHHLQTFFQLYSQYQTIKLGREVETDITKWCTWPLKPLVDTVSENLNAWGGNQGGKTCQWCMSCCQQSTTLATWPLRPLRSCMHNLHQRSWRVQGANEPLGILLTVTGTIPTCTISEMNGQWFRINKLRQYSIIHELFYF